MQMTITALIRFTGLILLTPDASHPGTGPTFALMPQATETMPAHYAQFGYPRSYHGGTCAPGDVFVSEDDICWHDIGGMSVTFDGHPDAISSRSNLPNTLNLRQR